MVADSRYTQVEAPPGMLTAEVFWAHSEFLKIANANVIILERLAAIEAELADHESRITALENP